MYVSKYVEWKLYIQVGTEKHIRVQAHKILRHK